MSRINESRFTLRQLRAFVLAADEGSFTRASRHLHITQSGLSLLIQELEDILGTALFHRTTRRVELTEAGQAFLPWTRRLLNELGQAATAVADLRDKRMGILRLAAPQLLASTLLPAALSRFRQCFPAVEIHLSDFPVEKVLEQVESAQVELALGPNPVTGAPDLAREPILRTPHYLVCRKNDLPVRMRRVRWQALSRMRFISPTQDFVKQMQQHLGEECQPLLEQPGMTVVNFTTAFGLVAAGFGVTLAPPYARSIVEGYGLRLVPLEGDGFARETSVWSRRDRQLSPAAEAFLCILREIVSHYNGTVSAKGGAA